MMLTYTMVSVDSIQDILWFLLMLYRMCCDANLCSIFRSTISTLLTPKLTNTPIAFYGRKSSTPGFVFGVIFVLIVLEDLSIE